VSESENNKFSRNNLNEIADRVFVGEFWQRSRVFIHTMYHSYYRNVVLLISTVRKYAKSCEWWL